MGNKYKLIDLQNSRKFETIRYIFVYAGIQYDEMRINQKQWKEMMEDSVWNSLPLLEIDGEKQLGQPITIARFLAKELSLAGRGQFEQAIGESVVEALNGLLNQLQRINICQEPREKDVLTKHFRKKSIVGVMDSLQDLLSDSDFFINSQVTWVDLHFYAVMEAVNKSGFNDVLNFYENLSDHYDRVGRLPRVKSYVRYRDATK